MNGKQFCQQLHGIETEIYKQDQVILRSDFFSVKISPSPCERAARGHPRSCKELGDSELSEVEGLSVEGERRFPAASGAGRGGARDASVAAGPEAYCCVYVGLGKSTLGGCCADMGLEKACTSG